MSLLNGHILKIKPNHSVLLVKYSDQLSRKNMQPLDVILLNDFTVAADANNPSSSGLPFVK